MATTAFPVVTLFLWCLLVPLALRMIQMAPSTVRLALVLGLGRFLFLSFLLFYTWNSTQGTNEIRIDLLARLYLAADATVCVLIMEHWHALAKSTTSANRKNHLIFIISLLIIYWGWLISSLMQLHLS